MTSVYRNLLSGFLSLILLYLVASIEVVFDIPAVSIGQLGEAVPTEKVAYRFTPQLANLAWARNEIKTDSILFVGDVLLARNVEYLMVKHGADHPYQGIDFEDLAVDPFVIGNFEASVPEVHEPTMPMQLNFSVDPVFLRAAEEAGFTHFSLANNHAYDFDSAGYFNTREKLEDNRLESFGHPNALNHDSIEFLKLNNSTVANIAIHSLDRVPLEEELDMILGYASLNSDYQVIYIHWGNEYSEKSSEAERKLAKKLVDAGADLIIGHHPHVVQEVGLIDGVPVFYSLGNYIFDQYKSSATQEGLIVMADFELEPTLHLLPVTSEKTLSQPTYMSDKDHYRFLNSLAEKSDPELFGFIQRGVIPMDMKVASSSKIAIIQK